MELAQALRSECIAPNRHPRDKAAALGEVARAAKASPFLGAVEEEAVLEALQERETLGSTGFGKGIAIPHCRLEGVEEFVVGLITVPEGVDFDATDGEPVRVIAFIVGPVRESNEHIRLLSSLSQMLLRPGVLDRILSESATDAIGAHLLGAAPGLAREREAYGDWNLFHIFVQDEGAFRAILQVLAGMGACSVLVVRGRSERAYLAKMPLFADFWTEGVKDFGRILVAVAPKNLTNEIVRRIEEITGPLDGNEGILVAIQNLFYCAGSLRI